jgi:phosphoesterase RecJ-like protein
MEQEIRAARQLIQSATNILVVTHIRPDGDAIGSLLGFGLALESARKSVQMVSSDGVPATFRFLAGSDRIRTQPKESADGIDLIIVVDASELSRTGTVLDGLPTPHINIDHHPTNTQFAGINLVEVTAVACAEMIALLLPGLGLSINKPVAEALLAGMLTDTIGFRTNNMSARALRVASTLMDKGANLSEIYQKVLLQRSYQAMRFWGFGLSNIQRDERLVWTTLTMEDRKLAGYSGRDDADLINILSSITDVDISVIFVEQPDGNVKVSWRAAGNIDISGVAQGFGGGGHRAAAGATLPGPLAEAQRSVLEVTRKLAISSS